MDRNLRKPFQGVVNIIRFNWHFYAIALPLLFVLVLVTNSLSQPWKLICMVLSIAAALQLLLSLFVSWYVYDVSPLYRMNWLSHINISRGGKIVNIHAGFDETSGLLQQHFSQTSIQVFDFFDAALHTEPSIKRARKMYAPYPGTISVSSQRLPLTPQSIDAVFLIMAAHEIRNKQERQNFFNQLAKALQPGGCIVLTEHLRDLPNFLAFNIGLLHFHSYKTWQQHWQQAGLELETKLNITPFVSTFILRKYGHTS